ncbi:MAG: CRISPR-associated protein Csx19 [Chloroflexus sp.]|uniref:type III-D CRISPR-associated protein Csx19 n=1 Tax=Chloroflexus sp. TaxID=1904827 RepID=UPI0030B2A885
MKYEIKTGQYQFQYLPVSMNLETELQSWLDAQARIYQLNWLLAHADDGVIWGKLRNDGLHLSGDAFPDISPPLRAVTLQQVRLFGSAAELLLWRDGSIWQTRVIQDGAGEPCEYYDESHLLWGDRVEERKDGFLLLRQGSEGLRHTPPLPQVAQLPAQLRVRHYLAYDADGQAYVAFSRLIALQ